MEPEMSGAKSHDESSAAKLHEFEVVQETITRRIFTVPASSPDDALKRWLRGEGEIARKETDDWKLYALSCPFTGLPGTSSAAGGSWGNS